MTFSLRLQKYETWMGRTCLPSDGGQRDDRQTAISVLPSYMLSSIPFRRKCVDCIHPWSIRTYVRQAPRNHNPSFQYVLSSTCRT